MKTEYDENINKELFSIDFQSDYSDDEVDRLLEIAKQLIAEYGDQVVFDEWFKYLKNSINGRRDAWNFMIAFYNFDGHCLKVSDPYPFLGLLLNRLELSLDSDPAYKDEEMMFETYDSIYIELLIKAGIVKQDEYFDANPYTDEKLKTAVEENK